MTHEQDVRVRMQEAKDKASHWTTRPWQLGTEQFTEALEEATQIQQLHGTSIKETSSE